MTTQHIIMKMMLGKAVNSPYANQMPIRPTAAQRSIAQHSIAQQQRPAMSMWLWHASTQCPAHASLRQAMPLLLHVSASQSKLV
jgi:hypothetical protein